MFSEKKRSYPREKGRVRLFLQDEASFGRVSDPRSCWTPPGERAVIHSQLVREYITVYGAVEPATGDKFYTLDMPEKTARQKAKLLELGKVKPAEKGAKARKFNAYLKALSEKYSDDYIIVLCDNAGWHKGQYTVIPGNMELFFIPAYTPEMNPKEQVWREIRTTGFHNKFFETIAEVKENFEKTVANISAETIKSITQRDWLPCCG